MGDPTPLSGIPLLRGLDAPALERVGELLRRNNFASGTALIAAEHPGQEVYILIDGTVKVTVDQSDGSSLILAILGRHAVVGEMGVVRRTHRSATVTTLERTTVLWMYREDFERCLDDYPSIGLNLAGILAQRLRLANERLLSFVTEDVDQRVARVLLSLASELGVPQPDGATLIPIRLTQTDLAEYVGAARISANRAVAMLKDERLISVDRRYQFTICDLRGLERRCG